MKANILLSVAITVAVSNGMPSLAAWNDAPREHEHDFRVRQQEARHAQEESLRAQEEQARRAQEEARRSQEELARKAQEDERRALQQQARQEQLQRQAIEQQEHLQRQQAQLGQREREWQSEREQRRMAEQPAPVSPEEFGHWHRPAVARELNVQAIPLEKAVSMPMFDKELISENERAHAEQLRANIQAHLLAIPLAQAPVNYQTICERSLNYYTNNYQVFVNNQPLVVNRTTTFVNPIPVHEYPYWYQPEPGWVFSNGFTLGNLIRVGLDWLGFGWHPYFGPTPSGFICAANYVPTPWIYYPGYGLWRLAGAEGWAPSGPPFDYTGPITVEALEPRQITVVDPFTGWRHHRYINVPYLYNAYFYPDYDRWGYVNRHGYFVWVNV